MQMYFSPSKVGFYCKEAHGDKMPDDCLPIPAATYAEMAGQHVVAGPSGMPIRYVAPTPPEKPVEVRRQAIKDAVTAERWRIETGGITLPNGVQVLTGKDDQDRITSTILGMEAEGMESVDFKADSGWVTLTLDGLCAIRGAIARHVQACFTNERAHHEAIDNLLVADFDSYDVTTGWPAQADTEGTL